MPNPTIGGRVACVGLRDAATAHYTAPGTGTTRSSGPWKQGSVVKNHRGRAAVTGIVAPKGGPPLLNSHCRIRREGEQGPEPEDLPDAIGYSARAIRVGAVARFRSETTLRRRHPPCRPRRAPGPQKTRNRSARLGTSRKWWPALLCIFVLTLTGANPWADTVVSWTPGLGGAAGFDNPATATGPPERYTGEATAFPTVVSPFSPAWGMDELVSIGLGGSLVLAFDEPIRDDAHNPFGIDLLIFGNTGMIDGAYPAGACAGLFGADGGRIEVSWDGDEWIEVLPLADGPWPTMGWTDAGPYDSLPGTACTDCVRPIDPGLSWELLMGQPYEAIIDIYGTSAGGVGIDLADVGLNAITMIRISVDEDAFVAAEIDAVVDVGRWGDATGDHLVTVDDVLAVVGAFGLAGPHPADRTFDGVVGVSDLLVVLETWP